MVKRYSEKWRKLIRLGCEPIAPLISKRGYDDFIMSPEVLFKFDERIKRLEKNGMVFDKTK